MTILSYLYLGDSNDYQLLLIPMLLNFIVEAIHLIYIAYVQSHPEVGITYAAYNYYREVKPKLSFVVALGKLWLVLVAYLLINNIKDNNSNQYLWVMPVTVVVVLLNLCNHEDTDKRGGPFYFYEPVDDFLKNGQMILLSLV